MTSATHPYKVALFRIKYNAPGTNKKAKVASGQMQLTGKKRKSDGKMEMTTAATTSTNTQRREYEYVDIHALYEKLCNVLDQNSPPSLGEGRSAYYMRMLAVLIGLSGTDFSRNLPHVGPTVLWNMILEDDKLFAAWANSYDEETNQFKIQDACNGLAARLALTLCFFECLTHYFVQA